MIFGGTDKDELHDSGRKRVFALVFAHYRNLGIRISIFNMALGTILCGNQRIFDYRLNREYN